MKGGKKDIGKAFNEQLQQLKKSPDDALWGTIEKKLNKKRKRRFFIWFFTLAGLSIIGILIFNQNNFFTEKVESSTSDTIVKPKDKPQQPATVKTISNDTLESIPAKKERDSVLTVDSNAFVALQTKEKKKYQSGSRVTAQQKQEKELLQEDINSLKSSNNETLNSNIAKELVPVEQNEEVTLDSLKQKNPQKKDSELKKPDKKEEKDLEKDEKFAITVYGAPTVLNPFSNRSVLNERLDSLSQKTETAFSYGAQLRFKLNKRLGLRLGAGILNLKRSAESIATSDFNGNPADILSLSVDPVANRANAQIASFFNNNPIRLEQQISYLEVPVEISYLFIDKKIKVDAIGGLSTLFLIENRLDAINGNQSLRLGEADNLSNLGFSINIGAGLHYDLSKNIRINIEPVFKYHIKSRNANTGASNLYSFGIYTGFTIKF